MKNNDKVFECSRYTRLFWNEWQLDPDNCNYNVGFSYRLEGELDTSKLESSIKLYIDHNPLLKANFFSTDNNDLFFRINSNIDNYVYLLDWFDIDENEIKNKVSLLYKETFDLEKAPLIKFYIIKLSDNSCIFSIVWHHILMDGTSTDKLLSEISHYYNNYNELEKENISNINLDQWINYLSEEKEMFRKLNNKSNSSYWTESTKGHDLYIDLRDNNIAKQVAAAEELYFSITGTSYNKIMEFCNEQNTTPFIFIVSAWSILISVYANLEFVPLTYPVNMRPKNYSSLKAALMNILPVVVPCLSNSSVRDVLKIVSRKIKRSLRFRKFPFENMISEFRKEGIVSRTNPFLNFSVTESRVSRDINGPNLKNVKSSFIIRKNLGGSDIGLEYFCSDNHIDFAINYNKNKYESSLIRELIEKFNIIIFDIINKPDIKFSDLNLLSKSEFQMIVYDWNQTESSYSENKTIHQLFEEMVEMNPDNVAVVFGDDKFTYQELNKKANKLAHTIRSKYKLLWNEEIKGDTLIGLYIERSLEMIISILAILKSGAAYVPFDNADPEDRVKFKISDCGCKMVLTSSKSFKDLLFLTETDTLTLSVDSYWNEIERASKENPTNINTSSDLAYIIYTSGSTGKPKGVMLEHKGVINLYKSHNDRFHFSAEPMRMLHFASIGFDASVSTMFSCLISGSTLYICDSETREDVNLLQTYINDNCINFMDIPAKLLEVCDVNDFKLTKKNLNIIVAGETCNKTTMELWSEKVNLFNAYGPTEATVCTTCHKFKKGDLNTNIGKAISNKTIYILNDSLKPVPIGVIGELYIGGDGLARGYFNRSEMTKQCFIDNPYTSENDRQRGRNLHIYRTGDLCRYLPNGDVEFIGRNDDQIKLRGFRIELGEIEYKLSAHEKVNQSIVLCRERESGDKYLIAYYTLNSTVNRVELIESSVLKEYLSGVLPNYMVPSILVEMNEFPLNASGKIDKKALPVPELNVDKSKILLPRNEFEIQVLNIWKELLELEDIGINDNFFDVGGNSILLIRMKALLESKLGLENIQMSDLFKYPTIGEISNFFIGTDRNTEESFHFKAVKDCTECNDIAVIGYSGAFSGSNSIEEFWEDLLDGRECIEFLDKTECLSIGVSKKLVDNPSYISAGGRISNIEMFDPLFWGISPNEASLMDPQTRKFLEHSWNVLENSGYLKNRFSSNIGVFAGAGSPQYLNKNIIPASEYDDGIDSWEGNTLSGSFIATRVSYLLGLTGPALNIFTACSTSLATIIEASKNLRDFSCDFALAGGVTLPLIEDHGYIHRDGMINSKDGHCRPFDINSSGTVGGAGVGVVLLKRLKDAEKDGDHILSVIKGYSLNNDGNRKVGYTAPSVKGQFECILNAQRQAGITSDSIDYVECHGTGTSLGDPIEISALADTFLYNKSEDRNAECVLGSVKANIGHADAGAGIAGFIKVCKMLETKIFPPQINYTEPNPELHLERTPFRIVTEKEDWEKNGYPRRGGISSFGIGGTNAHVILEEYCNKVTVDKSRYLKKHPHIIPLSAKSSTALNAYKDKLINYIRSNPNVELCDIAYALQTKKELFEYRNSVVGCTFEEITGKLTKLSSPFKLTKQSLSSSPEIVFMFSGQGAQYPNMCRALYNSEICFKNNIDRCCKVLSEEMGIDFKTVLFPKVENSEAKNLLKQTKYTQPALFTICYSLAKQFEEWGIKAVSLIGHSIGEYTAAVLSGVFTLEDGLKIVAKRGHLMQQMTRGSMLSINASESVIREFLPDDIEFSVFNTPEYCVVSGEHTVITDFSDFLTSRNIISTLLHTSHAFHSRMMDEMIKPFEVFLQNIKMNSPTIPFISNITGEYISEKQARSAHYWSTQVRKAVQFSRGLLNIGKKYPNAVYVELGAGNILASFAKQHYIINKNGKKQQLKAVYSVMPAKEFELFRGNDLQTYEALGKLWNYGYDINWDLIHQNKTEKLQPVSYLLPTYQFDRIRCWIEKPEENRKIVFASSENHCLYQSARQQSKLEKKTKIEKQVLTEKDGTDIEKKIASIFNEVLGIEEISKNDDFFELGGSSLLSIQVSSKCRKAGFDISIKDIFSQRTISNLAGNLPIISDNKLTAEEETLVGEFDLLPIQKYFFERHLLAGNTCSQSFLIRTPELNLTKLKEAIKNLISYHDNLRLTFQNGKQKYSKNIAIPELKILDRKTVSDEFFSKILVEWQSSFNIEEGPLWSVGYIYGYNDNSARIFIAAHHLIIDLVSLYIIIEDIKKLYNGEELSNETHRYRQWVAAVKKYPVNNKLELNYWKEIIKNQTDYAGQTSEKTIFTEISFDKNFTSKLIKHASKAYHTEITDLLLTALTYSLKDRTGEKVAYITLCNNARDQINDSLDMSRTIGCFTKAYPVRLELKSDISNSIKCIKEYLRNIPKNGIGYGAIKCYENSNPLKGHILPLVYFNYLGELDSTIDNWQLLLEKPNDDFFPFNENAININCLVFEGELKFYITSKLSMNETDRFSNCLRKHFNEIIRHCVSRKKIEYTISDFEIKREYEEIVIQNERINTPCLIMLHPASSGAEAYMRTLCKYLRSDIRLILINNYKLYSQSSILPQSIEQTAELYIKFILDKNIILDQAYIVGWSWGGTLSYEILYQLQKKGFNINKAFLIDPVFYNELLKTSDDLSSLSCDIMHKQYFPNKIDSTNTDIFLLKCMNKIYEDNVSQEQNDYCQFINAVVENKSCGLKFLVNKYNLIKLQCHHDQVLDKPYVENIADIINKNIGVL